MLCFEFVGNVVRSLTNYCNVPLRGGAQRMIVRVGVLHQRSAGNQGCGLL